MHGLRSLAFGAGVLVALPLAAGTKQAQNGSSIYQARFAAHNPSTPRFENFTGASANPMVRALQPVNPADLAGLQKRADNGLPIGTCAPGTPCSNGACCSKTGVCGYSPDQCGSDVCLSDCDAKAECGEYSEGSSVSCPLNVCCSKFGFCGTTDEFCTDECQTGFGTCGPVSEPSCSGASSTQRTIGYYEGWASQRPCDTRFPSDIDVTAMTHINFAFVYFHPTTFEIIPKDASDVALYSQFTALKLKKPSLETWVSIGGWAFNDATNSPNTQTAFSDMSSNAANRKAFITSLIQFMNTYGFDGVDIDWEYPGADDRGGVTVDTANFALLLSDLKTAFQGKYGKSVDFFNFMSYDIHGVWDSTSKFTGPYVRPHTNLTEIRLGLDLLWRNNISPSEVNLGLGWYGRSFTLKDPSCNIPGCIFSEGGNAGECTNSTGTLSNAEIQRIIASDGLSPTMDREAAVKWITWGSNQWVSYDDGETMQMKLQAASELCLGGTMIWTIDQEGLDNTSSNDLMGIGTANGVSPSDATKLREYQASAKAAATVQNSCYWSFCGDQCAAGFISEAYAKGQVAGIELDMNCSGDEIKTLCCAPGTNTGTCSWSGWRGVGMACATGYCPDETDLIAVNSNSYVDNTDLGSIHNLTCNGGSQSYCCSGFVPSSFANTDSLNLIGQTGIAKRGTGLIPSFDVKANSNAGLEHKEISKRGLSSNEDPTCVGFGTFLALVFGGQMVWSFGKSIQNTYGGFFTWDVGQEILNMCVKPTEVVAHEKAAGANGVVASAAAMFRQGAVGPGITDLNSVKTTITAKPDQLPETYGPYSRQVYEKGITDCSLTYTCHYGRGFNEICDNQRYAIEKGLNGKTVFHMGMGRPGETYKDRWRKLRGAKWYKDRSPAAADPNRWTCEVDEFPLASLRESLSNAYQVVRLLNGPANARQGQDWNSWRDAYYEPCVLELGEKAVLAGIPVTWKFSPFPSGDNRGSARLDGEHFLQYYGFDSQTRGSECWATYTWQAGARGGTSTVSDQGFRALPDDPMYAHPYDWPAFNNYAQAPSENNLPTEIFSAQWLKREVARSVLQQDLPLSAISETEQATDILKAMDLPPEVKPTDPATYSHNPNANGGSASHQSFEGDFPQETGGPHARRHPHGHGHRKWHY